MIQCSNCYGEGLINRSKTTLHLVDCDECDGTGDIPFDHVARVDNDGAWCPCGWTAWTNSRSAAETYAKYHGS